MCTLTLESRVALVVEFPKSREFYGIRERELKILQIISHFIFSVISYLHAFIQESVTVIIEWIIFM